LTENCGSKATPRRPRSPLEFTVTERNGVGRSAPFLMTRSWPPCRQTNSRPSGAKAMAVGLLRPVATRVSVKPEGRVAAWAAAARVVRSRTETNERTRAIGGGRERMGTSWSRAGTPRARKRGAGQDGRDLRDRS
jgi:hypothetical protein